MNSSNFEQSSNNREEVKNEKNIRKGTNDLMRENMPEYIYAYDPLIRKRVVHVVKDGWAISLVTGHRFRYKKGRK